MTNLLAPLLLVLLIQVSIPTPTFAQAVKSDTIPALFLCSGGHIAVLKRAPVSLDYDTIFWSWDNSAREEKGYVVQWFRQDSMWWGSPCFVLDSTEYNSTRDSIRVHYSDSSGYGVRVGFKTTKGTAWVPVENHQLTTKSADSAWQRPTEWHLFRTEYLDSRKQELPEGVTVWQWRKR